MKLKNQATTVVIASFLLTTWMVASFAVNAITSSESRFAKPIIVSKAEFGIFRVDNKGKVTFLLTNKVPLNEGNQYGWRIWLKDYQGEVTWREVLRLPKLPESWSTDNGDNFSMTPNGIQGVTTRTQSAKDGIIQNSWTILRGDPIGKHTIFVYIADRRIASFEFEVVPVKK
ncbi:MAG: hypothetical protein DSM106950_28155 [Stigonema ocellatum SAG 48.90 = DSM 106950]|nr:hypothetical protein [Stigonema ocellatum SAG 48.90 = DSM 106950]